MVAFHADHEPFDGDLDKSWHRGAESAAAAEVDLAAKSSAAPAS